MKKYNTLKYFILFLTLSSGIIYYNYFYNIREVTNARLYEPNANIYGYKLGARVHDFKLASTSGKAVSMGSYPDARGFIIVFTCNACLYSQAYEKRMKRLDSIYTPKGWPVIAINPNNPSASPEDAFVKMQERAKEKNYSYPYLADKDHQVADDFGASHTPLVYIVKKKNNDYYLSYAGTMDDNTWDDEDVSANYVAGAVAALNMNKEPEVTYTKAIGCKIIR